MKVRCGIDMLVDDRIKKNVNNVNFMDNIYHKSERFNNNIQKLASVFFLFLAVFKALDILSGNWLEIEVSYNKTGKPEIILSNDIRPEGLASLDCSVTHENGMTQAIVVMLLEEK